MSEGGSATLEWKTHLMCFGILLFPKHMAALAGVVSHVLHAGLLKKNTIQLKSHVFEYINDS